MGENEKSINGQIDLCFLDLTYDQLKRILDDEELSQKLTEHDNSSAIAKIDELMNLHEAPMVVYLLNDCSVLEARGEWTVKIPQQLFDSVKEFLANPPQNNAEISI